MGLEPITGQIEYDVDTKAVEALLATLNQVDQTVGRLADAMDRQSEKSNKNTQATLDVVGALDTLASGLGKVTELYSQALSMATEFGQSMGQVATLSTEVSGNLEAYNQQVLTLSASMGVEATQAADTFYQAISSGAASDAAGGLAIVETALKASVGGATDAAVAVDGITTAMNAWKSSSLSAEQASDILFKSVALGKTTMGEMSASLFNAGPLAASLGISLEEVAAATATLTKSGTPTSVAMNQLKAAMTALLNPNEKMIKVLQQMQQQYPEMGAATGQAALEAFGFHRTMQILTQTSGEMGISLAGATGSTEAMAAALGVSGQNAEVAMSDLDAMNNAAGETQKAYEVMANTYGFASNQLRETTNAVLIELGTTLGQMLVPAIHAATEVMSGLLDGWNNLDDGTKQMIVTIGGLTGAIGSGIGLFLTLKTVLAAVVPLFSAAAGGMTLLQGAMMATGIGAVVIAIGALVKGMHDLNSSYDQQFVKVQEAGGGFESYLKGVKKAQDTAGTLAKTVAILNYETTRTDLQVRKAGEAYLEYTLGVDKSVLSSRAFQIEQDKLRKEFARGKIDQDQYQEKLIALADKHSLAADKGHVLSESQREVSTAFAESMIRMGEQTGWVSEATLKSTEFQAALQRVSEAHAQGTLTQEQATAQIMALGSAMDDVRTKTEEQARAMAAAEGSMQTYSDGFQELFQAGSQWSSDVGQMNAKVEESWTNLSGGIQKNLTDQYSAWEQYQTDLAAAREADAQAAAGAAQKRVDAEAGHNEKMVELNKRMEDAKTDKQRESAAKAIAKENEKLAGILSATESIGGANVAKVQEQYNQQVEAQREALAQMIVDHVNSMVLMGQTSEETAKTIFATLREAYPGVEVLSPVADAHAELMGAIRDATDESSDSQLESIARLPDALDGALGLMQETTAEHDAMIDGWATAQEQLAGSTEAAADTAATATEAAGDRIIAKGVEVSESVSARTAVVGSAMSDESAAHAQTADDVDAAGRRIKDSSEQTASSVSSDAQSIEDSSGLMGGGFQMAADEVAEAAGKITKSSQDLTTATADTASKMAGGYRALLPELEGFQTAVVKTSGEVDKARDTSQKAGKDQERSFQQAGGAAKRLADDVEDSMSRNRDELADTQDQVEDLTEAIEDVPDELRIDVYLLGIQRALEELHILEAALHDLMEMANSVKNNAGGLPPGGGGGGGGVPPPGGGGNPRDDSYPPPPEDMLPPSAGDGAGFPGGSATDWSDWADSIDQASDAWSEFVTTAARGFEVNAYYKPDSPAMTWAKDRMSISWAITDLYDSTTDPVVVVMMFEGTDQFRQLTEDIADAKANLDELRGRLDSTLDAFVAGGKGEEGSLAWLFNKWEGADWLPDFGALMEGMNLPFKTMEEFQAGFSEMDPAQQMDVWKRLYDDLRRIEKERHEERSDNLKRELREAQENGKELYAEQLEDRIRDEDERYERINDQLEDQDRLIKRQYDDWKDGVKALADAEKELERQRRDFQRQQIERLRAQQKAAQDFEKTAHDRIMEMLDEEEERLEAIHKAEMGRMDQEIDAEKDRHDAVMEQLRTEEDRIKRVMEARQRTIQRMKTEYERWLREESGLDRIKADLKEINDAIRDIPSGRDLMKGGRDRPKPEDMVRVDLTQRQKDVIAEGLAAGMFDEADARRAQVAIQTGRLRIDYLRRILTLMQKAYQGEEDAAELEAKRRRDEISDAELKWEIDRQGYEDRLEAIGKQKQAEEDLHDDTMTRLEAERTALETKQEREMDVLERLREAEEKRHDARMKQLEEEFAMALMIAEGLTPEEAARKIAEMRANVQRAREEAGRILEELRRQQGMQPPPPGGGIGVPVPPIAPPVPPGPRPPGGTPSGMGFEGAAAGADMLGDAMHDAAMTLREFMGMIPDHVGVGAGGAGIGGGALLTAGDQITTTFWGPVIITDDSEAERLLRKSLGGGWGTTGSP